MSLGKRIASLRNEKNITQEYLSNILDVLRATIAMYETDKREPDNTNLNKLADYFNVSIDYLLGRTDSTQLYELKDEQIPVELMGIGVEYITVAKRIKEEGLTPQEVETMIEAIKKIKNDNQ